MEDPQQHEAQRHRVVGVASHADIANLGSPDERMALQRSTRPEVRIKQRRKQPRVRAGMVSCWQAVDGARRDVPETHPEEDEADDLEAVPLGLEVGAGAIDQKLHDLGQGRRCLHCRQHPLGRRELCACVVCAQQEEHEDENVPNLNDGIDDEDGDGRHEEEADAYVDAELARVPVLLAGGQSL